MSINARLTEVVATVLEVSADSINDQTSHETVESWDSMRALFLVTSIEEEFGVQFTNDEILSMTTFAKIREVIEQKLS